MWVVLTPYRFYGEWPNLLYVRHELRQEGLNAIDIINSFPRVGATRVPGSGYAAVWHDRTYRTYRPESPIGLTVAAGLHMDEFEQARTFVRAVNVLARQLRGAVGPLQVPQIHVTSGQLSSGPVGTFSPPFVRQLPSLLQYEPANFYDQILSDPDGDGWSMILGATLLDFDGVVSVRDYLERLSLLLAPSGQASTEGNSPEDRQDHAYSKISAVLDSNLYDFAFSFAGEHRAYLEATKNACEDLGLKVFYDRDKNNEWWGKNFIVQQRKVYGAQARYFVPFISVEYLAKPIPADEFQAALLTAVEKGDDYILPVLIGDVQVPSELLHPHTHYFRTDDYTPEQLAREMQRRLGRPSAVQPSRDIAEVVSDAISLRMPKVVPQTFSKYRELKVVFDYLARQFEVALPQLGQLGFVGTLDKLERVLSIRIERSGRTVYAHLESTPSVPETSHEDRQDRRDPFCDPLPQAPAFRQWRGARRRPRACPRVYRRRGGRGRRGPAPAVHLWGDPGVDRRGDRQDLRPTARRGLRAGP
jgi:hypothetical protein